MAVVPPLPAVSAQQPHPPSQTQAEGPAALKPPLTPHLICPKLAAVSFLGSAPCLPPQARLLQIRWVLSNCWAPILCCDPSRHVCLPLPCEQSSGQCWTVREHDMTDHLLNQACCCFHVMTFMQRCKVVTDCYRLRRSRGMKAVAADSHLAAVPAQQSHPLRQTEEVGPPPLLPPLTPPLMCPVHVLLCSLGWAPCLPPQASILQNMCVLSTLCAPVATT